MRREERELSTQDLGSVRISPRELMRREERVVDPGSAQVRISPRELMRREERELSTQDHRSSYCPPHQSKRTDAERRERLSTQDLGPRSHQSKRTDAERRERVVDPGSGLQVRISPRELMRREERELSTQRSGAQGLNPAFPLVQTEKECAAGVPASPHSQSSHVRSRSLHLVPKGSLKLTLRRSGTLAIALSGKHGLQTMK